MAISLLMLARRQTTAHPATAGPVRYGDSISGTQRLLSAGLSIGIAGVIGGTLILALVAPALVTEPDDDITWIHNIRVPQPDPPPATPQPTATPSRPTTIDRPIILRTPDAPVFDDYHWDIPPIGPTVGEGTGGTTIYDPPEIIDPPRPEPVFRGATRDPRYASAFQPPYPAAAEREGIAGTVRVRVHIGADGRVTRVEDLGSTDPRFFTATQRHALARWRFRPATRDGVAVESTQELTVRFVLPSEE